MNKTFYIQSGFDQMKNIIPIIKSDHKHVYSNFYEYKEDMIAVGSVEFCEKYLGKQIEPYYYPDFLKKYISRKIWKLDKCKSLFIKPSAQYKKFGSREIIVNDDVYVSEFVDIVDEWRYYVANGKILCAYWYAGKESNIQAPSLDVEFPVDFCGAVDFALLTNGKIELIENHHPYGCGWYGEHKDDENYVNWLIEGWEYTKKKLL